jgi:competence protein ComEC
LLGVDAWRPAAWWLIAGAFFAASGIYFVRRHIWAARTLGLCALVAAGAFCIQVLPPADIGRAGILPFTDGQAVNVTGHIIKEGVTRFESFGNARRSLDIETEQIESGGEFFRIRCGIRVSFYSKEAKDEDREESLIAPPEFQYGARLRFPTRLFAPRNFGNPGAFDYRGYLSDHGISALGSAKLSKVEVLPGFAGNRLELYRTRIHRRIVEKIHQLWPPRQAALIDAMVIGEDGFLGQDTRTEFQRSGTYHVLVVSGMNVAILAFVVFWILRRARISDFVSSVVTVGLAVGYAFVTDVGAPIWRATLMLMLFQGARLFYRSRSMLNAIGAAALGVLIADPKSLLGASFQLTFLCVLLVAAIGIPVLERTSQPYLRGLRNLSSASYDWVLPPKVAQFRLDLRGLATRLEVVLGKRVPLLFLRTIVWSALAGFELLLISAVMQLGLALPMAYYFHRATVVGLPANLLVVPLMEVLMPAAVMAVSIGFVSVAAAKVPALVAGFALEIITGAVHWLGALRIADTRVATPALVTILLSAAALALAMVLARRRAVLVTAGAALLTLSAFWIAAVPPRPQLAHGVLEVTAIDVGQGDSILVVSPEGRTLLVDAGGTPVWMQSGLDIGENVVSPYLWSRGISYLDTVAITHAHSDHMGGMRAILANFRPRELWLGVDAPSPSLQAILEQARAAGVRIITHRAGDTTQFGEVGVRVLAPSVDPVTQAWRRNDDSLAMKVSFEGTSALLEGDAERQTEQQISTEQPQADLLKVGHHGSATSTIPELLAAVHPKFAVISVGARNVYGHPRREVLDRLKAAGVATYRTDVDGAVTFYLDGHSVTPRLRAQY